MKNIINTVEVTWNNLSHLKKINNKTLTTLVDLINYLIFRNDANCLERARIGCFEVYFDDQGKLHLDFSTNEKFSENMQKQIAELVQLENNKVNVIVENFRKEPSIF